MAVWRGTRKKNVVRPKFKKGVFPDAYIKEVVDELYSPGGRGGNATCFHRHHQCGGQQMVTTLRGRRLARCVSSHSHVRSHGVCEDHFGLHRNLDWQELWVRRVQNPLLALKEALRRVEEREEVDRSTAGGCRT